jgi:hypothetical protein
MLENKRTYSLRLYFLRNKRKRRVKPLIFSEKTLLTIRFGFVLLVLNLGMGGVRGAVRQTPPSQTSSAQTSSVRIPVVLSTDVGNEVDDQWTIAWLLLSPRLEVLGVMSAHAPSLTAPAGHTSYRILRDVVENRLAMRTHPPLIEGGSLPMEDAKTPRASPAVDFLIEKSKPFTKENRLTVLMIGAGTDVASAILTDPGIVDRIRVIQMGYHNQRGGNEFNIANDLRGRCLPRQPFAQSRSGEGDDRRARPHRRLALGGVPGMVLPLRETAQGE